MGALVTVNPPAGPASSDLPWIVTIGPLGDDVDWEPVVCGPYERAHALAMAKAVVVEDELMAVVEPIQAYLSVRQIQGAVAEAMASAVDGDPVMPEVPEVDPAGQPVFPGAGDLDAVPDIGQVRAGLRRIATRLTTL